MIILQMEFNNLIWHGLYLLILSFAQSVSALLLLLSDFFLPFSHVAPNIKSAAETNVVHEIALVIALPSWLQPRFRVV